jgi:hypothetical protein
MLSMSQSLFLLDRFCEAMSSSSMTTTSPSMLLLAINALKLAIMLLPSARTPHEELGRVRTPL